MADVVVRYSSSGAFARDALAQFAQGILFLARDLQKGAFAGVDVDIVAPDGAVFSLRAEVLQTMSGVSTVLQASGAAKKKLDEARAHAATLPASAAADGDPRIEVAGAPAPSPPPSSAPDAARAEVGDDASDNADIEEFFATTSQESAPENDEALQKPLSESEISLQSKLEGMTIAEKRYAATHGTREMRWLLLRDINKALHPFVMKNPNVQMDEIEQMARMTSINPNCLHEIAAHRDWTKSTNVVRALVRNPKTPVPDAVRLVEKVLPQSECQALAKMGSLRMPILMAARKKARGG